MSKGTSGKEMSEKNGVPNSERYTIFHALFEALKENKKDTKKH